MNQQKQPDPTTATTNDYWFRVVERIWNEGAGVEGFLIFQRFRVLRRTAKGVWLEVNGKPPKFVLNCDDCVPNDNLPKRFAYADPQKAHYSYIIRKRVHISYEEEKLRRARTLHEVAIASYMNGMSESLDFYVKLDTINFKPMSGATTA